jgi:hypothetical protein
MVNLFRRLRVHEPARQGHHGRPRRHAAERDQLHGALPAHLILNCA